MSEEHTANVGGLRRYIVEQSRGYGRFEPFYGSDDLEQAKAACNQKYSNDPFVSGACIRDTLTKKVVYFVGSDSSNDDPAKS